MPLIQVVKDTEQPKSNLSMTQNMDPGALWGLFSTLHMKSQQTTSSHLACKLPTTDKQRSWMNCGHMVDALVTSIWYTLTVCLVPQLSLWRYHTRLPTPNLLAAPGLVHNASASRLYIRNWLYLWDACGGPAPCLFILDVIYFSACSSRSSLGEKQLADFPFLPSEFWMQDLKQAISASQGKSTSSCNPQSQNGDVLLETQSNPWSTSVQELQMEGK